ncbi:hypothetical protein LINGRAHAP2_LOCUS11885 [Linum grandiflorum]
MQVPRWRNVLILKNTLIPAISQSNKTIIASIHSTPVSCDRWNSKGKSGTPKSEQPSKNHVRFAVRQKRADTKKALKHLLFNSKCSGPSQVEKLWNFGAEDRTTTTANRKMHAKSRGQNANRSGHSAQTKRKFRNSDSDSDLDDSESAFRAKFGNKWYTWSFDGSRSTHRSERTESPHWTWRNTREERGPKFEEEEPPVMVGSCSDRRTLGLPPSGPLQIEQVKTAFRVSALKWHPDRHEGDSQAVAAEKFKLCVSAYNSLCSGLS